MRLSIYFNQFKILLQKQDASLGMEKDLSAARKIMSATKKEWSGMRERNLQLTVEPQKAMKDGDAMMDFVLKSLEYVILIKIVWMDQMKLKDAIYFQIQHAFHGMVCAMRSAL